MATEEFWSALGLDRPERDLYESLIGDATESLDAHAAKLGMDGGQARAIVDSLVQMRLVHIVSGRAEVLEPRLAVSSLAQRRQATLDQRQAVAAQLADAYSQARADQAPAEFRLRALRGDEATALVIDALDSATRAIDALVGPPIVTNHSASAAEYNALQRGVIIRSVVDSSLVDEDFLQENIDTASSLGEQLRCLPGLVDKMLIIDRATVILPLVEARSHAHAVVSDFPPLVAILQRYFDLQWSRARSLTPEADAADHAASRTREGQLEMLLRLGLSDAAICRRLDISDRTMRRRMQALCEAYGVRTRVQLGIAMAEASR